MAIVMTAQLEELVTLAGGGELEEIVAEPDGGFVGETVGEQAVTAAAYRGCSMADGNRSSAR